MQAFTTFQKFIILFHPKFFVVPRYICHGFVSVLMELCVYIYSFIVRSLFSANCFKLIQVNNNVNDK